ncbi:MAG: hypothetical protein R6W88_04455 [Desulfobacterales bacterium]
MTYFFTTLWADTRSAGSGAKTITTTAASSARALAASCTRSLATWASSIASGHFTHLL